MKITKLYILILFFLIAGLHSNALAIDLLTKTVELTGNISAEKINVIYSDSSGYLWLGTKNGLYRWDGFNAVLYQNAKGSEDVTIIKEAPNGKIWVGYNDGAIAYTNKRSLVSFHDDQYANDSSSVTDILFDLNGGIWWSTYGSGLYFYHNNSLLFLNNSSGLNDNYIYDLEFGNDNKVWVATDNGINICYVDSITNKLKASNFSTDLPDLIVLKLIKDHEGFMWFGFHQEGVYYYNPADSSFSCIRPADETSLGQINALSIERKDIWVLDKKNGLFFSEHPHKHNLKPIRFKGESLNKDIRSVITDYHGNLYILTKKSLYVSSGPAIVVEDYLFDNRNMPFHSIVSTKTNEYWLTTNSNLIKFDEDGARSYLENKLHNSSSFNTMTVDHTGNIWIGTLGQGIIVFNPSDETYHIVNKTNGLINDNVLSIAFKNKTIWVATLGGATAISLSDNSQIKSIRSFDKEHGLSTNFIYTVFPDSKGRIWFGTDGNGILIFDNNIFKTYDELNEISDKIIYSITEDQVGNIWFSTSNSFLYKYDGFGLEKINPGEGFSGQNIYSLAIEEENVFILTDDGLNIYNYSTGLFVCLKEELGLDQIISDLNSVCKGENSICFASHGKIIHIDLELIKRYSIQPKTSLDRITVNLEAVSLENYQSFSSTDNKFVFEYVGSWPLAQNRIQYMVKLEGYDPEWKNTYDRTAIYPNLQPGKYIFKVKAILNKTGINEEIKSFSFTIRKPFYRSVWFIVFTIITILLLMFWFIKTREKRLKKIEAQKKEKLEFEFQTLKNQINPHFLFNSFSTLISIIEERPKEAVGYADALSGFFRDILEVKEQQLITVAEELRMLSNYSHIHQKRLGDNFVLNIQLDEKSKQSKIPPLTFQLLTENALKHNVIAKGKPLTVNIWNEQNNIIVENNRRLKKQVEKSIGVGLRNIKDRYNLITNNTIIVKESKEFFRVILPIITN